MRWWNSALRGIKRVALCKEGDARAAADAVRCGTAILASAHARTIAHASARRELGEALRAGLFERIVIISGPCPGEGINVFDGRGNALC